MEAEAPGSQSPGLAVSPPTAQNWFSTGFLQSMENTFDATKGR